MADLMYYAGGGLILGVSLAIVREVRYVRGERKFQQVCAEHSGITKDLSEFLKDDTIKIEFK